MSSLPKEQSKLLICVPTKDRPEIVKDALEYELPYYKRYDLDICYYDSSESDDTYDVIRAMCEKHSVDIGYRRLDSSLCIDMKIVEMYRELENSEYDYIWMINDAISISEEMIRRVISVLHDGYDIIRFSNPGENMREDHITFDPDDWFNNCSFEMSLMASTIIRRSLLDAEHNWEELVLKYIGGNEFDDNHGYFFCVGFYLEQIAKLSSFKGLLLGNTLKWHRLSPLKKGHYWNNVFFDTWARSYPETIMKLPDIYTNKVDVIRESEQLHIKRFNREMFIRYRLNGMFDMDTYRKYRKWFELTMTEPVEVCAGVASTSVEELKKNYPNLGNVEEDWENKLNIIEGLIANRRIYIYGAGHYGENATHKLIEDGYRDQIEAVVVTNADSNVRRVYDIEVKAIDDVKITDEDMIILCALPGAAVKMRAELVARGIESAIGLFDSIEH